jgi:hypothetical protein
VPCTPVLGEDSSQMVDRFEVDVIDWHPVMVVILAGANDVSTTRRRLMVRPGTSGHAIPSLLGQTRS